MAKNDKSKEKKDKKGKKGKGGADGISVAGHPRAAAQVRRAKGFGGVTFFLITAYFSYKAQVPADQVAVRALIAGIGGYMLAWMCAVTVWRQLVLAELRAAVERTQAPDPDLIPARAQKPAPGNDASPAQATAGS